MRIIAGDSKGRRLEAPPGLATRPTSDRVREAIFNILGQRFEGGAILDLYAGSGAFGLEALSRGAERATFVDQGKSAAATCQRNIEALGFQDRSEILRADVAAALRALAARSGRFALVFADPPYEEGPHAALELLSSSELVEPGGRVVAEHSRQRAPDEAYGELVRTDVRRYGDTTISFFSRRTPEPP